MYILFCYVKKGTEQLTEFWGWINKYHCVSSLQRVREDFLWVFMIAPVKFRCYISVLPGIWFVWLMETFICPALFWKAAFRSQSHCIYSKITRLVFNTFQFDLFKKKCTKPVKYFFFFFKSELLHFKKN